MDQKFMKISQTILGIKEMSIKTPQTVFSKFNLGKDNYFDNIRWWQVTGRKGVFKDHCQKTKAIINSLAGNWYPLCKYNITLSLESSIYFQKSSCRYHLWRWKNLCRRMFIVTLSTITKGQTQFNLHFEGMAQEDTISNYKLLVYSSFKKNMAELYM